MCAAKARSLVRAYVRSPLGGLIAAANERIKTKIAHQRVEISARSSVRPSARGKWRTDGRGLLRDRGAKGTKARGAPANKYHGSRPLPLSRRPFLDFPTHTRDQSRG